MSKSKWPKRTLVVACLLMSGVATQVNYEPGFFLRTIASQEEGVTESEATDEAVVSTLPNHEKLRERLDLLTTESSSLKEEILVLVSKLEDKSKSSKELQALVDNEHSILKEKGMVMLDNFNKYIQTIQNKEKISAEVSEEQRKVLEKEVFALLSDFSKASDEHSTAIYRPEELVEDAKIREHSSALESIKSTLCEQKQAVSALVSKIEKLIEDKEEVVAEVEENEDSEGEDDVADSTEDTIDFQNYLMGMYVRPMYKYTPFMMNTQSPYDIRVSPYSYLIPNMMTMGYGQGFGHFNSQFSIAPQIIPQVQTDYLSSYYGLSNRQPSSLQTTIGGQVEMGTNGQNFDMSQLRFGNDFVSNSSMGVPSQVMRIPQYSRSIVNSNATRFPVVR